MAEITLRFNGRFLFTQPEGARSKGPLTVLALRMESSARNHSSRHRAFLSIQRMNLPKASAKTFSTPHFKIIASGDPLFAEHAVWDYAGWDVAVQTTGQIDWSAEGPDKLADLKELEARRGRTSATLKADHLEKKTSAVASAIAVPAGICSARSIFSKRYTYVLARSKKGAEGQTGVELADVVEVKIPVETLTVKLTPRHGRAKPVVIKVETARTGGNAVVNFSNLCALAPAGNYDEEFAAYYDLLSNVPPANERLIPESVPAAGEMGDCYLMAYMTH